MNSVPEIIRTYLFIGCDSFLHLEFETDKADSLRKHTQRTKTRCRLWNQRQRRTAARTSWNTAIQALQNAFEATAVLLAEYDIKARCNGAVGMCQEISNELNVARDINPDNSFSHDEITKPTGKKCQCHGEQHFKHVGVHFLSACYASTCNISRNFPFS